MDPDGDVTSGYGYDAVGNRTSLSVTTPLDGLRTTTSVFDAANRLTSETVTQTGANSSYGYDQNGNQTSQTLGQVPGDTGKTPPSGTTTYTWDTLNRLTAQTGGLAHTYNGDSLRVRKVLTPQQGAATTTQYAWDLGGSAPALLAETSQTGAGAVSTVEYVSGPNGLHLQYSGDAGNPYTWYQLTDALGSVRTMVSHTGVVIGRQEYAPYGGVRETSGTAPKLGFTGEQQDGAGLVYLRARWYNPSTGRFLSKDPVRGWRGSPASQHAYQYGYNNPGRYTDRTGRIAFGVDSSTHETTMSGELNLGSVTFSPTTGLPSCDFDACNNAEFFRKLNEAVLPDVHGGGWEELLAKKRALYAEMCSSYRIITGFNCLDFNDHQLAVYCAELLVLCTHNEIEPRHFGTAAMIAGGAIVCTVELVGGGPLGAYACAGVIIGVWGGIYYNEQMRLTTPCGPL